MFFYLLVLEIIGLEPVALADDCWVRAPSDGIQLPVRVVVVHDVGKSPPDTWHSLYAPDPEPVERDRHLHDRILRIRVRHVVDPHAARPVDADGIPVALRSKSHVANRVSNHPTRGHHDVMDPHVVYDYVAHELYRDPGSVRDVNLHASTVDRLVASHD
ncbi:argininosuccinate synthase [Striga asiatica]|uniref:Argininosuccinate synthase n=1 Tax=Striga asiatica TaxID=4170 RepID=A0A5A7R279_STRAF|nr:argininosuccinate synthase [Striga asiatica]